MARPKSVKKGGRVSLYLAHGQRDKFFIVGGSKEVQKMIDEKFEELRTNHKFIEEALENEENKGKVWAVADLMESRFVKLYTSLNEAERACSDLCSEWDETLEEKINAVENCIDELDPKNDSEQIEKIERRVEEYRRDFYRLDCRYVVLEPGETIFEEQSKVNGGYDIAGLD